LYAAPTTRSRVNRVTNMDMKLDSIGIGNKEYEFICRLVYERSRIHLGTDKQALVTSRLAKRLRLLQLDGYEEYCQLLRSPAGDEELRFLIDRISTNHTHFFREMGHFNFLKDVVFPRSPARVGAQTRKFRIWSAACSSGEEPYSLAIWLAEHLGPASSGFWDIEASDISTRVLDLAAQGIYEHNRLGGVPPELLRRYFQKGSLDHDGQFRIKTELRQRVNFHQLNLLEGDYPFSKPFEVIFCRNVMIYFDRATQEALVRRLSEKLVPGGYLMVGHSESLNGIKHSLRLVQPAIYIKAA